MMDALVIIPTYNEKENIVRIIEAVMHQDYPFDVLIIDIEGGELEFLQEIQNNSYIKYIMIINFHNYHLSIFFPSFAPE